MSWQCSGKTNEELIENLYREGEIGDERVRDAMLKVDRAHYCPPSPSATEAYKDAPLPIGHRATISAPHMHATALTALLPFLYPGARVLDIGSGSGYLTAVLAELVCVNEVSVKSGEDGKGKEGEENDGEGDGEKKGGGKQGRVVGLEHIQVLRDMGESNMRKSVRGRGFLESGKVEFVRGDGRKGWVDRQSGPTQGGDGDGDIGWDAIHVGAAATELHEDLARQLKAPGRIFIPIEDQKTNYQWIWVVDKDKDGVVRKEKTMGVNYVPLTDAYKD